MTRRVLGVCLGMFLLCVTVARAKDYSVETVEEAAPTEGLAAAIAEQLTPTALRINEGKKPLCDIWLVKQWPIKADFTPSFEILYPFEVGQLLGVVRYHDDGGDFRGQDIKPGLYTLRYGLQPVDGNHVGTSTTRDFALLLPVEEDQSPDPVDLDTMIMHSTEVSNTTHPALLSLLATEASTEGTPGVEHQEEGDLWSVRFAGKGQAGDESKDVVVEMVVVGQSEL